MSIYTHKHHIIPRHMGGTDDPSNLVVLSIEDHAQAHLDLYEKYGRWQDELAWKGLSGQINRQEIIRLAQSLANRGKKNYKVTVPATILFGKDNGNSSMIRVGDIVYDSMRECAETEGVSRVTVRNRILSKTKRFNDWSYYEE